MTLDANIRREALEVLRAYSSPAQELVKQNLYGTREARLAGAIVANTFTVEVHHEPTETELVADLRAQATEQIVTLCRLLRQTTEIIEERVAGHGELLEECEEAIAAAEEDFYIDEDGSHVGELKHEQVFVVVFPPLSQHRVGMVITDEITAFVDKLKGRGVTTWVADESDYTKRLKAMTMREIYNVGRIAAVVLTNKHGDVLDGWYNGMPWIEEVMKRVQELR